MRRIVDESVEIEDITAHEIRNRFDQIKSEAFRNIVEKEQIHLNIEDFYGDEVHAIELYAVPVGFDEMKLYLFSVVEYECELFFEFTVLDDLTELRYIIDVDISPDPDKVLFDISLYITRNMFERQ